MGQSQYATEQQYQQLAITPAAYTRFETAAPGCTVSALQAASSLLDSYLAGQFVLPLKTNPQGWDMSLTLATCMIAAKLQYNQFGYNAGASVDELIERRYDEAIAWAEKIRDKQIQPQYVDSSGVAPTQDAAGDFVISDAPVGFTGRGLPSSSQPAAPVDPWDGGI